MKPYLRYYLPILVCLICSCDLFDRSDSITVPDSDDESTDLAHWTFLIYMNGDNNLEHYVTSDLNILEGVGSGDGVHLVVQADRIPGYVSDDGDWTTTRRYYIMRDYDTNNVSSEVLEDLGELDMGSPGTLSDFLLWARREYPAKRTVLVLWDHGDSCWSLSDDATSGNNLSIAKGYLNQALAEYVTINGHPPFDIIAFDACLMASWEVAHSLQEYAHYMDASETYVGDVGVDVALAARLMREDPNTNTAVLVDKMAAIAVYDGEGTYSAVHLDSLGDLSRAVDELAKAVLGDSDLLAPLLQARNQARGIDKDWKNWYLDLLDLGAKLSNSQNETLRSHGDAIQAGIETAVIGAYGNNPFTWTGGLTITFDTSPTFRDYVNDYTNGDGATWSKETAWGNLLRHIAGF